MNTWIGRLQAGDDGAAEELWRRYHRQLVRFACRRLLGADKTVADEHDVVSSAFRSFFRAVRENRAPMLRSEGEIWRLLLTLTARKSIKQLRYQGRAKRRGGYDDVDVEDIIGEEPSPEFAAMVLEEFRLLHGRLPDDEIRLIALRRMEGYSSAEIAQELNTTLRTVQRRLAVIRAVLADAIDEQAC